MLWIHVAAAKVPHVVFGSLRDIEICEEGMADSSSRPIENYRPQI